MKYWGIFKNGQMTNLYMNRFEAYEKMKLAITNHCALGMLKVSFEKYQPRFGIGANFYAKEIEM